MEFGLVKKLPLHQKHRCIFQQIDELTLTVSTGAFMTPEEKQKDPQNQLHLLIVPVVSTVVHVNWVARHGTARLCSHSLTEDSFPAGQTGFAPEKSARWG